MANPHFANGNPNGPIMMTVPTNPGQVNLAILDIIHTNLESQLNPLNEKRVMSFHADARNIIGANGCAALVQRFK